MRNQLNLNKLNLIRHCVKLIIRSFFILSFFRDKSEIKHTSRSYRTRDAVVRPQPGDLVDQGRVVRGEITPDRSRIEHEIEFLTVGIHRITSGLTDGHVMPVARGGSTGSIEPPSAKSNPPQPGPKVLFPNLHACHCM